MPTGPVEKEPSAERGYSGFAVSEDHRRGRRARLRWRQEGQGKKTPLAGRYRGLGAKGESPRGQRGGPGGDQEAARWCQGAVPTPFTPVAGRWLQGPRERQKLGGEGFGMECGTGRTSAQTRPRRSADELGGGIGQGRQDSRGWQKLLPPRAFQVLPRRWVVERSFAWISHNRRMSKD